MKDGKLVANHSMPFGGGVSMCEGRYAVDDLLHGSPIVTYVDFLSDILP